MYVCLCLNITIVCFDIYLRRRFDFSNTSSKLKFWSSFGFGHRFIYDTRDCWPLIDIPFLSISFTLSFHLCLLGDAIIRGSKVESKAGNQSQCRLLTLHYTISWLYTLYVEQIISIISVEIFFCYLHSYYQLDMVMDKYQRIVNSDYPF